MFARVLSGQAVHVPEAFDGDQEPFVFGQAGRLELVDLVPKVILELVDVVSLIPAAPAT